MSGMELHVLFGRRKGETEDAIEALGAAYFWWEEFDGLDKLQEVERQARESGEWESLAIVQVQAGESAIRGALRGAQIVAG